MSAETLDARLASGAARLARCWRVTRRDGVVLGFTDHDDDIRFDGTVFAAQSGMDAQALERSAGLSVDNASAVGALSSDALTDTDVIAGRYDDARIEQWLVDWAEPEVRRQIFTGTIGEIREGAGAFEAELRGLGEALNRPVGRSFEPHCDAVLGDARCGVDLSAPGLSLSVTALSSPDQRSVVFDVTTDAPGADWFRAGTLRWESGANEGLEGRVRDDKPLARGRQIVVWTEFGYPVTPGDRATLVAGCDKRATTCREKFANLVNFRGFPNMPGEDWVTAYPRSGAVHDGSPVRWDDDDAG